MSRYMVDVSLRCTYEVEGDTETEVIEKAWDWFTECVPDFYTTRICCGTCAHRDEETGECPFSETCGVETDFRLWRDKNEA